MATSSSKKKQYKINTDKVLIVPGYTDKEILQNQDKKKKKQTKISPPAAFYFEVQNVQYTPHIASYEEFNSAQGLIRLEKACDRFAEVEMDVFVHQNLSDQKGKIMIDKESREARLRVNDIQIEKGDRDSIGILYKLINKKKNYPLSHYLKYYNAFSKNDNINIMILQGIVFYL